VDWRLPADSPALADAGFSRYEVDNARLDRLLAQAVRVGRFDALIAVDPLTADPVLMLPEAPSLLVLHGEEIDQLGDHIVRVHGFLRSQGVGNVNIIVKNPPFAGGDACLGVRWCLRERFGAYQAAGLELAARPYAFRLISTDPFDFAATLRHYLMETRRGQ
jgi:hypothetical protein